MMMLVLGGLHRHALQQRCTHQSISLSFRSLITKTTPSPASMMRVTPMMTRAACRVTTARALKMKCRCLQRSLTTTWSGTIPTWDSEHPLPCEICAGAQIGVVNSGEDSVWEVLRAVWNKLVTGLVVERKLGLFLSTRKEDEKRSWKSVYWKWWKSEDGRLGTELLGKEPLIC